MAFYVLDKELYHQSEFLRYSAALRSRAKKAAAGVRITAGTLMASARARAAI